MMTYRLARRARRDVLKIWQHIAGDNEQAADRFIDLLTHYLPFGRLSQARMPRTIWGWKTDYKRGQDGYILPVPNPLIGVL